MLKAFSDPPTPSAPTHASVITDTSANTPGVVSPVPLLVRVVGIMVRGIAVVVTRIFRVAVTGQSLTSRVGKVRVMI